MRNINLIFFILILSFSSFSQNSSLCSGAQPFCTGTTYNFPAPTGGTAQSGIDYGCLSSTPNPTWYYLKILNGGDINLNIAGASSSDDIDFACWGPYNSSTGGCSQLTNTCSGGFWGCESNTSFSASYPYGNLVDCSYDPQSTEDCHIIGAIPGEYYMVLITNYGGNSTNILFTQTNASQPGAGETDCAIICGVNVSANASACNPSNNEFSVSGTVTFSNVPTTGTLTVTSSCGGSQIFNPPFTSPTNYTFSGLQSNGNSCTVSAVFSADATCVATANYTEPLPCNVTVCSIDQLTANPSVCNGTDNTYSISGIIDFSNAPTSGTLTVSNSCGGNQVFNAPFNTPLNYSITNLQSNGVSCTVSAVFSDDNACTSSINYTAPNQCNSSACNVTASSNTPICLGEKLELYVNAPTGVSYQWIGPNNYSSNQENPIINPTQAIHNGNYEVTVTLANGLVCIDDVDVDILDVPITDFSIVYPTELDDFKVSLLNESSQYDSHYWLIGGDTVRSLDVINHDFNDYGVYDVCLINGNNLGCTSSRCKKVNLKGLPTLFVPNTFTPNTDNTNDFFKAYSMELDKFEISIYDKWGKLMFKTIDENVSWDGDHHGIPCKSDVYIWKITYSEIDNPKKITKHGHINLVR